MNLSRHTDYSCRVIIYLACQQDQICQLGDIASAFSISRDHIAKIVHNLGKLGYVSNSRGKGGGVRLAKDPSAIRIGDFVRTIEPSMTVVECLDPVTNRCVISKACGLTHILSDALAVFFDSLNQHTFEDVITNKIELRKALGI